MSATRRAVILRANAGTKPTGGVKMSASRFSSFKTDSIGREEWIFGGLGLLLVIDLLALPWFSFSIGPFSASLTATDAPDGWLAILAVLAAVVAIADLGVERLSPGTALPSIRGSRS